MNRPPITEIKAFVPCPAQFSKARELLEWSTDTAGRKAGLGGDQVAKVESDPRVVDGALALEAAYRAAGVTFALFHGPSGEIYKTRLNGGPWSHVTRRGPMRLKNEGLS